MFADIGDDFVVRYRACILYLPILQPKVSKLSEGLQDPEGVTL